MNTTNLLDEQQTLLLIETIGKNVWFEANPGIQVAAWSNFHESPDLLCTYLCKDGSGYIRGYYDGGTLYVKRFHLRDEAWTDSQSA